MKGNFKAWAKAAGLRAVRTFAQSAAASIAVCAFIDEVNWAALLSTAALAAVLSLLQDAYEKRDKVGIVAFRGRDARVLLPLTRSIDLARRRLARILTGGTTPLAAGLELAWRVLQEEQRREKDALQYLILLTDGRANVGNRASSPEEAALRMASLIGRSGIRCMVLDTESKYLSVGLAQELAARMNAGYESLPNLSGAQVRSRTAEFVSRNK